MSSTQREYKDRLFSFIFGREENREWTLSLYNAVNGTHYDDPSLIEITTIKGVLYLGMKNDVSFLISDEMNMYEQQSSYNPNAPLRMLQYAGNLYEKYVVTNRLNKYGARQIALPVPKLVVFYNGTQDKPDETTLKLSDSFPEDKRDSADIEVSVRMININAGRSMPIQETCEPLYEYTWVVDSIRHHEKGMDLESAIDKMIDDLPETFILRPFLRAHRAEVKGMLLTEYDEAEQMELFREEGRAEGQAKAEHRFGSLIAQLITSGRSSDVLRASTDADYRNQLYAEFGIA